MRVRIDVTARDIKLGCRADAENCPVTRACRRRLKGAWSAWRSIIGKKFCVETPHDVWNWMLRFDAGYQVGPISFSINVPESVVKPAKRTV